MKYSNIVLDPHFKAEEGDEFEELMTGSSFVYHEGQWVPLLTPPSTPEKVLSAAVVTDAEKAEEPVVEKPKKSAPKKKTTKKESK